MPTVLQVDKKNTPLVLGGDVASGQTFAEAKLVGYNSSGALVLASSATGSVQAAARGFVVSGNTVGDSLGGTRTLPRMEIYERGVISGSGLTPNTQLYLGTSGNVTTTAPTDTDTIVQVVGYVGYDKTEGVSVVVLDIRPQGISTN